MKKIGAVEAELKDRILSKYFSFDGKYATLKLVYDTFEELINQSFGDEHTEKLNEKLFTDIKEAIEILPKKYKLNVQILIKNFGEYTREECEEIISQNLMLSVYSTLKSTSNHRWGGLTLVGVGAVILILSYILHSSEFDVIFDVVNISGTLFVWEGVNTAFLQRGLDLSTAKKVAKALKSIAVEKYE